MAWEYLKTEPFENRYKVVSEFLKDKIENPIVVDLNCGEPLFAKHIKWKEYHANDLFMPDNIEGLDFRQIPDSEVDIKSDLLVMFGCGAGEFTGQDMESKTATDSFIRLAGHKPKYIVMESSPEWEKRYSYISMVIKRLDKYKVVLDKTIVIPPGEHYHDTRRIIICKLIS